ncbi:MAG: tetratricopeptide repeat protein [Planctomycetaceae bacterium]|nr:tetratricopeptide repeat protein [Planctomycetaceae bacterium]
MLRRKLVAFFALLTLSSLLAHAAPTPAAVSATSTETGVVDAAQIKSLIEQLGNDDYFVRERAQEQLATIGIEAFDALSEAENNPDTEIATRVRFLLRLVRVQWSRGSDPTEIKRLLEQYATADDPARELLVEAIAKQPLPHSVSVLCRIVRFEKSNLLSRLAALAIIEKPVANDAERQQQRTIITENLGASPRPTAEWLRAFVAAEGDPTASLASWNRLLDDEQRVLGQFASHTRSSIVLRLLKQQVAMLSKLNRTDDAMTAMRRVLAIEPEDNEQLAELLDWLVVQKAWPVIDEAAKHYEQRFKQDPILLYSLAEAADAQGQASQAAAYVKQARDSSDADPGKHYSVAIRLQQRGKIPWAIDEYRLAIKASPPTEAVTIEAQYALAELLHDQGQDKDAAQVLLESVTAVEASINAGRQVVDGAVFTKVYRSRMHYFAACEAEAKSDLPGQLTRLHKAIEDNPQDADVLISLYRFPKLSEAEKTKIKNQIRAAADVFRRQIQENDDSPLGYNQLAWLIGNTEGDYQEALRCSQKSLELRPNTAAYLDTLGRCYFAVGDLDNAIKSQLQAIKLEPHSGLMQRQLKQFEKAKAEKKS